MIANVLELATEHYHGVSRRRKAQGGIQGLRRSSIRIATECFAYLRSQLGLRRPGIDRHDLVFMTPMLIRNDERTPAIQSFGYTEREAAFLCLAALHGGYFLRRQYNAFLECHRGGNADRLIEKGVLQGHIRVHESANRTQIYHVGAKSLFKAIGEEDNRNRRWRQPYPVKVKLMGLDFVLAHQQHHYLATEAEKLDYFAGTLGLNRSYLPQRNYRSRHGRNITTRYFVDKFPLFLSGAPSAPSPVVGFCYVDGAIGKPSGFDTYLLQYKDLFIRLDRFGIIYTAGDERMFPKAERIFRRMCRNGAHAVSVPGGSGYRAVARALSGS